jgi:hypothetical protein
MSSNYSPGQNWQMPTGIYAGQSTPYTNPYQSYPQNNQSGSSGGGLTSQDIINAAVGIYGANAAKQSSNRAPKFYNVPLTPEEQQKHDMQVGAANIAGGYTTDFLKGINNLGTPDLSLSTDPAKPPKALWGMNMLSFPSAGGTGGATGGTGGTPPPSTGNTGTTETPPPTTAPPVGGGGVTQPPPGTFPDGTGSVDTTGSTVIDWSKYPTLAPDATKQLQSTMPNYDPNDPNMWEKAVSWLYGEAKKYGPSAVATGITLMATGNPAAAGFMGKLGNWFAGLFGWGTNPKNQTTGGGQPPASNPSLGGTTDISGWVDQFTGSNTLGGGTPSVGSSGSFGDSSGTGFTWDPETKSFKKN